MKVIKRNPETYTLPVDTAGLALRRWRRPLRRRRWQRVGETLNSNFQMQKARSAAPR